MAKKKKDLTGDDRSTSIKKASPGSEVNKKEKDSAPPAPLPDGDKVSSKSEDEDSSFPIVGIGSSAGGLEALEHFFANMPSQSGLAFVVIQHLDPNYKSMMVDLIKRYTQMRVLRAQDGMRVEPDTIYLNPPNKDVAIFHGVLQLVEPEEKQGFRFPIDFFFRSLAQDQGEKAICIVLSGTGTDGTLGLRAIKDAGGMTMAQDEKSAMYSGMPKSAIATGLVDFVLPVERMPQELLKYIKHPYMDRSQKTSLLVPKGENTLDKIFLLLRTYTKHDFSHYKHNTIRRRIERRMAVHQLERLEDYVRYLQQFPSEVELLFHDLLIGVTNFFRDPEAFEALRQKVIPRLFEGRRPELPIRVWVPGCSTGEEAYSIAILLVEYMVNELKQSYKVQMFATDIDSHAIEFARTAIYPASIVVDVPPERLNRFFIKEGNTYRVSKQIREIVVFAVQDLIKDPPFSKLDLISCRNVLIYLSTGLQKKILQFFHYVLNPEGFLILGSSESIGEFTELFSLLDKKWKIFQRKGLPLQSTLDFPSLQPFGESLERQIDPESKSREVSLRELTEKTLLDHYTPACVVINENYDIVYFHGRVGKYLELPSGEPTLNILRMAREDLRRELRTSIHEAVKQRATIIREDLQLRDNNAFRTVRLSIKPLPDLKSRQKLMLVVFEEVSPASPSTSVQVHEEPANQTNPRIAELEHELRSVKESLQTTIEELETSNEELRSTNEELQSTNEELQSTNEELETSKEELQSINEELVTVNAELQKKLEELSQANNDLNNLLSSTEIGTIFLDSNHCIKRFTPSIAKLINLIPTDIGRPLSHISVNILGENIVEEVKEVLQTLVFKEKEVQTREGNWYLMRILPYRTMDNVIDGAVITFINVTELKGMKLQAEATLNYAENILHTLREPFVVLDKNLQILTVNQAFCRTFNLRMEEVTGRPFYQVGNGQWDLPGLRTLLEEALSHNTIAEDYEIEHNFERIGYKKLCLNARKIKFDVKVVANEEEFILLSIEDITDPQE